MNQHQTTAAGWNRVMDRRRFIMASIAGAGALSLASCTGGTRAAQGRTVRLPEGAVGFPTPFASNGDLGYNQTSLLYDTLLWKDSSGQLLPWLATSFEESPDHLTYTFTLRDDVTWSDGRPLTVDDVVFTFDYFAKQETLPPPIIIQPPKGIAEVKALGATTIQVTLATPLVTFAGQVAGALPIIPRHVWANIDDPPAAQDLKLLVGSGAYRLESYSGDGAPMLYAARDDHFLGRPFVRRIELNAVGDPFAALLAGEVDVAMGDGLRPDILAPFQNESFGMVTEQGLSTNALYWNLGKEGPLSDVRFRRACTMAIDRQELVTRLAAGQGQPGNPGFLGPRNPFFAPVPQYELDVTGANALLDAAGYRRGGDGGTRRSPNGAALSFELVISNAEAPLSEILVASLGRIGVEVKPNKVQIGPLLFGSKFVGNYDMAVLPFPGPGPGGPNADPDVLRLLFSSRVPPSLQAATVHVNPRFDELAERQQVTFDVGERKAIVAQMQQMLAEDLAVLPLYYPEVAVLFRKEVLDQWYITPGQFPSAVNNKQLFITGQKTGTQIRTTG